jgi:hypothetical protein
MYPALPTTRIAGLLEWSQPSPNRRRPACEGYRGLSRAGDIEDPDEQLEPLVGIDGIEIHASRGGKDYGLQQADEQMFLALHCIGVIREPPPVILIQRRTSAGLFDRLADEFDERWEQTTPLPTRERLHAYLAEVEPEPSPEPDVEPALSSPQSPAPPTELRPEPPRRWPGRRA